MTFRTVGIGLSIATGCLAMAVGTELGLLDVGPGLVWQLGLVIGIAVMIGGGLDGTFPRRI